MTASGSAQSAEDRMPDSADPHADAGAEEEWRNPWTVRTAETRYSNPWISVVHHEVTTPTGTPGIYGVVRYRNHAVGVVPVEADGTTWIVGQWRFPLGRYSWEIPEGGAPDGSDPLETGRRELLEETGLSARHWRELMRMDLSNSVSDESATLYVCWELSAGTAAPEETERLRLRRLPLGEAVAMALDGRITDAMSVAALLKLRLLLETGGLPEDLAARARRGL